MTGAVGVARCVHFGTCGGCPAQDVPYEEQLIRKSARISGLLAAYWKSPVPVHPSPDPWFYRNKMEFSFGREVLKDAEGKVTLGATRLGQKEKGRWWKVFDLQECFLLSPETAPLVASVRRWAGKLGLEGYDQKSGRGTLRHLLVREAKGSDERMVMLITAPMTEFDGPGFVEAVRSVYPASTILRGTNAALSDVAKSEDAAVLLGSGDITEVLRIPTGDGERTLRFRISPFSFFQTNTRGAGLLYGILRSWASEDPAGLGAPGARVLDLYGGAGGIAFALADLAGRVVCVESNPSAAEDGRHNAALNGIRNVDFVTAAVEDFLASEDPGAPPGLIVVDPPRSGLHPKALARLAGLGAPRVLYVSCNPESLARDLGGLMGTHRIERVEAVDMFPHTDHVETVALLRRL